MLNGHILYCIGECPIYIVPVHIGLKQGIALLELLFNSALENSGREMQESGRA